MGTSRLLHQVPTSSFPSSTVRLQGVLLKLNTREKCSTLLMDYWGVLRFGVLARLFRQGI